MNKYESDFEDLIKQLKTEPLANLEPNRSFTSQLRARLLADYDKKFRWEIGRLTNTATVLAILVLVIFGGWYIASSQQPTLIAGESIQTTRMTEMTAATITAELDIVHSTLAVSNLMPSGEMWEATIEHWQTADGQYSRTFITHKGQLIHFVQTDGISLWESVGINPITSPNRRILDFDQQPLDELSAEVRSPFYADSGWVGQMAQFLVSSDVDCSTQACVAHLVGPSVLDLTPLESQSYGGEYSLVRTVEGNGRTLNIYHITYKTNQSPDLLSQYRQVIIDANSFEVISVADFDGDTRLRQVELIARDSLKMAARDFQGIPSAASAALATKLPQTFSFEDDIDLVGFSLLPSSTTTKNDLQFNIFWQTTNVPSDDAYGGFVHLINENNELAGEAFGALTWERTDDTSTAVMSFREQLPNGRYQIYAGLYDQTEGRNLLSDSDEMVLLDTLVLEDSNTDVIDEDDNKISFSEDIAVSDELPFTAADRVAFGDNVELTYRHYIMGDPLEATDNRHTLRLYWEARQEPTESLSAFVHILDIERQLVQAYDEPLEWMRVNGRLARPGFTHYALQSVAVDLPRGRYQVETGLYDTHTGKRISTVDGTTAFPIDEIMAGIQGSKLLDITLVSAAQSARTTVTDPLEFDLTLSYEGTNIHESLEARLRFVNPMWSSGGPGEPYVAEGQNVQYLPFTGDTITFHVTLNTQEVQQLTSSDIYMPVIDIMTTVASSYYGPIRIRETILLSDLVMRVNDMSERLYFLDENSESVNTFWP